MEGWTDAEKIEMLQISLAQALKVAEVATIYLGDTDKDEAARFERDINNRGLGEYRFYGHRALRKSGFAG